MYILDDIFCLTLSLSLKFRLSVIIFVLYFILKTQMSVHVGPLTGVIRELNVPTPQGHTRVHVLMVTLEME